MTDAVGALAALGRTRPDRALLGRALGQLDARYRLGLKITAEPHLAAIMAEFVSRLADAFGPLSAIRGRTVLDIACGSNSSRSPVTGLETAEFEPWMCRLLLELGARPVGIDIGDLAGEAFENHRVDLGVPGALDFLAPGSFDAIHESRLFGSPEFRAAHAPSTERIRREIHRQERRLLRPGGILIHSDGRAGAARSTLPGRPRVNAPRPSGRATGE
jgi:SAM-dependent methyltransferase